MISKLAKLVPLLNIIILQELIIKFISLHCHDLYHSSLRKIIVNFDRFCSIVEYLNKMLYSFIWLMFFNKKAEKNKMIVNQNNLANQSTNSLWLRSLDVFLQWLTDRLVTSAADHRRIVSNIRFTTFGPGINSNRRPLNIFAALQARMDMDAEHPGPNPASNPILGA